MTDDAFLAAFEDCSLPFEQWNHRAHVRVAYLYASRDDVELATQRMRSGVKAYNKVNAVPEALDRGYHETITVAFMRLISAAATHKGQTNNFEEFAQHWPQLFDKRVLLRFYSRNCIMSAKAKAHFVEPDLKPLSIEATTAEGLVNMKTTLEGLATAVGNEAGSELDAALRLQKHCVAQLTDDQLWWRPAESMNSIANLLLHLCGNLRQWIVAGVGGAADVRERQQEFDARGSTPKSGLMQQLEDAVADVKNTLTQVSADELLRVRRIQGHDVNGMQAIFHSVAHFRGHTQEIVHLTRSQLGDSYEFDFIPTSAEQGAPQQ